MTEYNLLMVGCGNMGSALLSGWLDTGLIKRAVIVKPSMAAKTAVMGNPAVSFFFTADDIPADFTPDMVILAVKPQILAEILPLYRRFAPATPFMSMAAGKTLSFFARHLGDDAAVIRTMPNLPVTVRRGVTGCVASPAVTPAQNTIVTALMEAVGSVHWVAEDQIDALTAVSGCGPAYAFLLQEVMTKAGEKLGLAVELAASLARETIIGTGALMEESLEDPAVLRQRVMSKGGVTEAAIAVLQKDNALADLMADAMAAVIKRAGELAE